MSLDATTWAWMQKGLTKTERLVLLSLADRAGEENEVFPSIKRIEDDCEISRRSVLNCLASLKDKGLIENTGRTVGKGVVVYRLVGVLTREQLRGATIAPQEPSRGATTAPRGANDDTSGVQPLHPESPRESTKESKRGKSPVVGTKTPDGWVIDSDWKPPNDLIDKLRVKNPAITSEFAMSRVDDFVTHYTEAPAKNPNWSAKFIRWIAIDWRDHVQRRRTVDPLESLDEQGFTLDLRQYPGRVGGPPGQLAEGLRADGQVGQCRRLE